MAPTDMEQLVTFPIETALSGAADVRRVRSATAVGVAVIWVEFDWGADIYSARQTVSERLGVVSGTLPPGTGRPTLGPITSIMGEILFVGLTSDRHDDVRLRTIADTVIRRRVLAIPGVSQVTSLGGGRKQYHVLLSPGPSEGLRRIAHGDQDRALRGRQEHFGRHPVARRARVPYPGDLPVLRSERDSRHRRKGPGTQHPYTSGILARCGRARRCGAGRVR